MDGTVRIRIHEADYVLTKGGMFMVPRGMYSFSSTLLLCSHSEGNLYHIQNIGSRDARLFFAQARRIPAEELAETRATSEASQAA
jgi:centromere protein C